MFRCTRTLLVGLAACAMAQAGHAAEAAGGAPEAGTSSKWEGAVGLIVAHSPEYEGASEHITRARPGLFLRYGRFSLSTTGAFVSRRHDDVQRGLDARLIDHRDLDVSLALRLDGGRDSGNISALHGVHDVRSTLRGRLGGTWRPAPRWRLGLGLSSDVLGRDGGSQIDLSAAHEWRIDARHSWTLGAGLSWADQTHMRTHYGITAQDSVASGYPRHEPGAGLSDARLSLQWRAESQSDWIGFIGGSVGRLLGDAADSPLTASARQWGLSAGLARRF